MWIKLDKQFFKLENDIYLANAYICPRNSSYSSKTDDIIVLLEWYSKFWSVRKNTSLWWLQCSNKQCLWLLCWWRHRRPVRLGIWLHSRCSISQKQRWHQSCKSAWWIPPQSLQKHRDTNNQWSAHWRQHWVLYMSKSQWCPKRHWLYASKRRNFSNFAIFPCQWPNTTPHTYFSVSLYQNEYIQTDNQGQTKSYTIQ